MAMVLHWLESIPQVRNKRLWMKTFCFYVFLGGSGVSRRNLKVARNRWVAGHLKVTGTVAIDEILGDIDRKYWTVWAPRGSLRTNPAIRCRLGDVRKSFF
jgi:hypothetical protein